MFFLSLSSVGIGRLREGRGVMGLSRNVCKLGEIFELASAWVSFISKFLQLGTQQRSLVKKKGIFENPTYRIRP